MFGVVVFITSGLGVLALIDWVGADMVVKYFLNNTVPCRFGLAKNSTR